MEVIPAVKSAVKKVYGKPMHVASKVMGVATIASVIYDSHVNGKERSTAYFENKSADVFYNQYNQYMSNAKGSATICNLKKWWFDVQQDFTLDDFVYKAGGYLSGVGKTVAKEIPVLTLSALTLIPKNKNVNKFAGTLLAINGVQTFLNDIVGIGSQKEK